ncbi:hypothetical protein EV122DRAFT_200122, partial [Schizophyllum commune]
MPVDIRKRLTSLERSFFGDGKKSSPVKLDQLYAPFALGGRKLLDLEARNDAISLTWLKEYLTFGPDRPLWAYVTDALLAHYAPKATIPKDVSLRMNPFLQTWDPYQEKGKLIPPYIHSIITAAKEYGLRLECLAPSRAIIRDMPMWYHTYADPKIRTMASQSNASLCLRENHKARTVRDFEEIAARRTAPDHDRARRTCECEECAHLRLNIGCDDPDACYTRANEFLNTLPQKWDPRGEHPEDYENENSAPEEHGWTAFDRGVVTHGTISDAFRIFTSGEVDNDRIEASMDPKDSPPQRVATDGSCTNNGERDARAGAGVYLEGLDEEEGQWSIRLPSTLQQSNQAGEMLAVLVAADIVD